MQLRSVFGVIWSGPPPPVAKNGRSSATGAIRSSVSGAISKMRRETLQIPRIFVHSAIAARRSTGGGRCKLSPRRCIAAASPCFSQLKFAFRTWSFPSLRDGHCDGHVTVLHRDNICLRIHETEAAHVRTYSATTQFRRSFRNFGYKFVSLKHPQMPSKFANIGERV